MAWAQRRFSTLPVSWLVAYVLRLPSNWLHAFDLVVEIYTLQVLPPSERRRTMEALASAIAEQGTLLVICRGRELSDPPGEMPWPLTLEELQYFEDVGLRQEAFDEVFDDEIPPVRRFVLTYRRSR